MNIINGVLLGVVYAQQALHYTFTDVPNPMVNTGVVVEGVYDLYVRPDYLDVESSIVLVYSSPDYVHWEKMGELDLGENYYGFCAVQLSSGLAMFYSDTPGDIQYSRTDDVFSDFTWQTTMSYRPPDDTNTADRLTCIGWRGIPYYLVSTVDMTYFRSLDDQETGRIAMMGEFGSPISDFKTDTAGILMDECHAMIPGEHGHILTHFMYNDVFEITEPVIITGVLQDCAHLKGPGMLLIPQEWTYNAGADTFAKTFQMTATECADTFDLDGGGVQLTCDGEPHSVFRVRITGPPGSHFELQLGPDIELAVDRNISIEERCSGFGSVVPVPSALLIHVDVIVDLNAIEVLAQFGDETTEHIAFQFSCEDPIRSILLEGSYETADLVTLKYIYDVPTEAPTEASTEAPPTEAPPTQASTGATATEAPPTEASTIAPTEASTIAPTEAPVPDDTEPAVIDDTEPAVIDDTEPAVPPHPCLDPQGLKIMLTCAVWEQVPWLGDILLAIKMPFLML